MLEVKLVKSSNKYTQFLTPNVVTEMIFEPAEWHVKAFLGIWIFTMEADNAYNRGKYCTASLQFNWFVSSGFNTYKMLETSSRKIS